MELNIPKESEALIHLIRRSDDIGDGWRQVSSMLWTAVLHWASKGPFELDHENKRVRLSSDGDVLAKYIRDPRQPRAALRAAGKDTL